MRILALVLALCATWPALAQQVADPLVDLSVAQPAFRAATAPSLVIDGAHNNFHTADGRYAPFAQLMRNDGLVVSGSEAPFSDESLAHIDVLVIANALAAEDVGMWRTPNPSAFTADEIAAVRRFVENGGSLLLIADHMPFGGAAQDLGAAFGVHFDNGFAVREASMNGEPDLFTRERGLADDAVTEGVTQVRTFTGSAFTAENARPLLHLNDDWQVLLPEIAWEFTDATPRVSGADRLQGALLEIGEGRVAVFGEAAMFTAQVAGPNQAPMGLRAPGAEANKQFALNVVRWLARAP